jgi:diaminohydroxyphosphoribosylaminopyrimidine deaminase/5-amino-6-(5-phosphoribosylamino)uracil reductase
VGAAVVSPDGRVLAIAAHAAAGQPHAEVLAIEGAGDRARGSALVVSLEPCDHHGRTPPCTRAIIDAGITRVVVGAVDPDPRVAGAGIARLRAAGVEVETGVCTEDAQALDPGYFHHRRTGRPLVTLKTAVTLDGQAAAADGTSQWITSAEARHDAHVLRSRSDAIVVGAGTLRTDDPLLTVRLDGYTGHQPHPVVVAGTTPLPSSARLWARNPLVYGPAAAMAIPSGTYVPVPDGDRVDIGAMVKDLGVRGFIDLQAEGGPTLARSLLDAGSVDRVVAYVAGRLAGGTGRPMIGGTWRTLADSRALKIVETTMVGPDVRITAEVAEREEA